MCLQVEQNEFTEIRGKSFEDLPSTCNLFLCMDVTKFLYDCYRHTSYNFIKDKKC